MSKFKQHVNSCLEFENGYQVFFDAGGIAPYSIWVHIWHTGDKIPLELFISDKANGYFTPDEFARLLFKVSKAAKPILPEEDK